MNSESTAEVDPDSIANGRPGSARTTLPIANGVFGSAEDTLPSETSSSPVEHTGDTVESTEFPFYIVPSPPIPGKTAWSIA
jgi:hypothetical protein